MTTTTDHTRIGNLQELLRRSSLRGAALVSGANLAYLTGLHLPAMERLTLLLVPAAADHPIALVLPTLEATSSRDGIATVQASGLDLRVFEWHDNDGPAAAVRAAVRATLPQAGASTLAVEYLNMRVGVLRALESVLPSLHTSDVTPLMARLRVAKTADELAHIQRAVAIIEAALSDVRPLIVPGTTERQLAARWKQAMLNHGADEEAFPCIVASGSNSANPHHQNSDRPFERGDLILLDGGVRYNGYVSDITRTFALGTLDEYLQHVYELVLAANTAARLAAKPGVSGAGIDTAARTVIEQGGYGEAFLHRTGHGIGLEIHERPTIAIDSHEPLPTGATFTIEPGIYVPGRGGVRIEDDIVLTADGSESLTTFPRNLQLLPAD